MQEPQENAIQPLPFLSSCPLKLSSLWQPHEGFNIYSEPTQAGHKPAQRQWLGTGRKKQLGVSPSPLFPPLGSARGPGQVGAPALTAPHPLCQTSRAVPAPVPDMRGAGAGKGLAGGMGAQAWLTAGSATVDPSNAVQGERALILKWGSVLQQIC